MTVVCEHSLLEGGKKIENKQQQILKRVISGIEIDDNVKSHLLEKEYVYFEDLNGFHRNFENVNVDESEIKRIYNKLDNFFLAVDDMMSDVDGSGVDYDDAVNYLLGDEQRYLRNEER